VGVYWDASFSFPLPLLGAYYIDLNFRRKQQQLQAFFGGPLFTVSFNEPRLFGTDLSLGANVFGVLFRGSNFWYVDGVEDPAQQVKDRSSQATVFLGVPFQRHLRATLTVGVSYRDFKAASDTSSEFAIPSDGATLRLSADLFWNVRGWALSGNYGWFRRNNWGSWGYPGNPEWDPSKTEYRLYGVTASKDFPLPGFRLIKVGTSWLSSSNTDRFSEYTFGSFGGTPLTGFSTGNLRAQEAIIVRGAYGYVFGNTFRLLASYEQAWVTDEYAGYNRVPFAGAGITAEMPGPWTTIVRLDAGLPVVGRNRGATGGVIYLTFLKLF
jgi:outer membrane protein assembly factor BamA